MSKENSSGLKVVLAEGGNYLIYDIYHKPAESGLISIFTDKKGLGPEMMKRMNMIQAYFEEKYYMPFSYEFQIAKEGTSKYIDYIPDTAPSVTLGIFLYALIHFRNRVLRTQWDSVIVTGDVSYNSGKNKEVQLESVEDIYKTAADGKYPAVKKYAGDRNVLFVYVSNQECTDAKNTDRITVKHFMPGNGINEILSLIFEPYDLSSNPPSLKGKRKRLFTSVDESQSSVFTKDYIRPDGFDKIENDILYDDKWGGYYIHGEGESGKSATAVGIIRYLGYVGRIYAPVWIGIDNERFSEYTDKYPAVDSPDAAGNFTASDKYIYSLIYERLFQKNLTADGFSQDHMNRLVEKFDKRYLIVIDNLELAEDKIILVLESLKKLLFYKEDIYKPFIIVTSRTNFLDKLLLDLGIKPIRPLDLKKKMKPFLKMVVGEAEYNSRLANQGDFETLVEKISEKIGDLPGIIVIFIMLLQYKDMEIGDLFQILDTNMGGNEKFTERLIVKIFKTAFDRLEIHVQKIFLLLLVLGPDNVQEKTKITGLIGKRIPALADKAIEALEQLEKSCLIYTVNEPGNDKIGIKSTVFLHILFDEAFKSDLREKELPELWSYWDYWRLRKALRYDQPVNVIESLLYRDYPEKKEIKRLKYNLHMAIAARNCSYPKALDLLQQAGCGVNDIDVHIKLPPLFYALAFNHHKNVISILDWFHHNKKYRKRKEFNGVTALQIAVAFASNYDVLEWLKNNGYKTYKDTDVNLFNHAAKNNANAGFMEILCKKFDIHMRDFKGKRPLHHAAALNENPSVVKLLIDEETINSRDKDRMTPLHHAAFNPNYAVTKVLLAYNACIGAVDKDGDTPLHIAVACNTNVEVARALLDAGSYIYINTPNKDGYTPLYNALAFGNHEVYNLLNIWRRS